MKRGQRDAFPSIDLRLELKPRVRDLRHEATPAETKLWAAIRDGKLGDRFEREYRGDGGFFDFFCPEARVAVEIEGHIRTAAEDATRQANLETRGIRLLRFTNDDVLKHLPHVLKVLREALAIAPIGTLSLVSSR